jgi:uncharacterized protein YbaA (DUF1428 family)
MKNMNTHKNNDERYIDGFVFPINQKHLDEYKKVSEKVAEIWREYGAISYFEFVGDDMYLDGTLSFNDILSIKEGEIIIFGWVVFPSKDVRDMANERVPKDPRMNELVAPLVNPQKLIFDAGRMAYGGFKSLL